MKYKRLFYTVFLISFAVALFAGAVAGIRSNHSSSPGSGTSDWPMFHHDPSNTGYTSVNGPDTNDLLWKYKTDDGVYTSPAVADGKVYVGAFNRYIYCLDAITGNQIWRYEVYGHCMDSSPAVFDGKVYQGTWDSGEGCGYIYCLDADTGSLVWRYRLGGYVHVSSPVVVDGELYVGCYDHYVYCLDADIGSLIWRYNLGSAVVSSPAVVDDRVYVGNNRYIYCLDASMGSLIWKYQTGDAISASSPAVVDGKVYVGSFDHYVYCLDSDTGSLIWRYETNWYVHTAPAIANGKAYVGCYDGTVYCLDAGTGSHIWNYTTGFWIVDSSPAVAGDNIYIGSDDYYLYCLDADNGSLIWKCQTGGYLTSPAVADEKLYIGCSDGNVYCFGKPTVWPMFRHDPAHTGYIDTQGPEHAFLKWSYTTDSTVTSSAAVVDGKIYIGSGSHVYCLDADSGSLIWKYQTFDYVHSSPAVVDGKVYIGSDSVYCLNASNGEKIWNYHTGDSLASSPAIVGAKVYLGSNDYYIYCLDADTGSLIWKYETGYLVTSSPAIVNDRVYVGSRDYNVYCLDASTGTQIWNYTTGHEVESSPAIAYGRVYIGSIDNHLYCLDADNGSLIWKYQTDSGQVRSSPAVFDGRVYVGSTNGYVYCLNASTGSLIWRYKTDWGVPSSPAVVDGKLYIGSDDYYIYCLDADTGSLIWKYQTGDFVDSSPAVVDGKLYIGSLDLNIYCLEDDSLSPQVSIASPDNGSVFWLYTLDETHANVTVSWNGSDNYGISNYGIYVNHDFYMNTTSTSVQLDLSPNTYKITVVAYDLVGNWASRSISITVAYEQSAPQVSITSISNGSNFWLNTLEETYVNLSVIWSGNDNYGISSYSIFLNGFFNTNTTSTSLQLSLSPDSYNITIIAYDYVGNQGGDSVLFSVTYEQIPPKITITDPNNDSVLRLYTLDETHANVTVSWTAIDNYDISNFSIYVSGNSYGNMTSTSIQLYLQPSTYNITIIAYDFVGNWASHSVFITVSYEQTPPEISITSHINGERVMKAAWEDVVIEWVGSDNYAVNEYAILVNGTTIATTTETDFSLDLGSGTHNITVVARDYVGNESSDSKIIIVERPPPEPLPITTILIVAGAVGAVAVIGTAIYLLRIKK